MNLPTIDHTVRSDKKAVLLEVYQGGKNFIFLFLT